jgi:hypothetical protein
MHLMSPAADLPIVRWRERFRGSPLARSVVTALTGRADEIWRRTFDLLRKESPEYRNAVDDEFTIESKSHCGELLRVIVAIAAGKSTGSDPFAFVRRHAEWRARHRVPLVASLHAYRLAHKTYWGITREQLSQYRRKKEALHAMATLSDFWIELFEAVGAVLEEVHTAEEARIVARNTRAHDNVVEQLLAGRTPSGAEALQLLTLCGLRPEKHLTVAVIRPVPMLAGRHADAEVAERSMVRLLHQVLPSAVFGKLIVPRAGEIVLIANSGSETSARLLKHLSRGLQASARVGLGLDKPDIAGIPESLDEARVALEFTGSGRAAMRFADLDLAEALIHRADALLLKLIPEWIRTAHRTGNHRDLLRTAAAFAECDLNVKETAARLGVHTNTVYFRSNQIRKLSGVDPRTFAGSSLLLTSLRLLDNRHGATSSR